MPTYSGVRMPTHDCKLQWCPAIRRLRSVVVELQDSFELVQGVSSVHEWQGGADSVEPESPKNTWQRHAEKAEVVHVICPKQLVHLALVTIKHDCTPLTAKSQYENCMFQTDRQQMLIITNHSNPNTMKTNRVTL